MWSHPTLIFLRARVERQPEEDSMDEPQAERAEYPALDEAVLALPSRERIDEMVEINLKYARCESDRSLPSLRPRP